MEKRTIACLFVEKEEGNSRVVVKFLKTDRRGKRSLDGTLKNEHNGALYHPPLGL